MPYLDPGIIILVTDDIYVVPSLAYGVSVIVIGRRVAVDYPVNLYSWGLSFDDVEVLV